jgi:hypothetical protein
MIKRKESGHMKTFITADICTPEDNYMVDLSTKVEQISVLVERKKYFTVNRARQYGKTTTLMALERFLSNKYDVVTLDFQDITDAIFKSENDFTKGLAQVLCDTKDAIDIPLSDGMYQLFLGLANEEKELVLNDLFRLFDKWCRENSRPIVLIIDEVDSATNNQVFLDFLGKLRSNYLKRKKSSKYRTFQSVILAGVTDVKHLKSIIREEADSKENSPWNIAADFTIDMSLSAKGIKGMLDEYEADHHTGMNTEAIANLIRDYTNGYPFLVSRICQLIDERLVPEKYESLSEAWSEDGVEEAVKIILTEKNTLFDSLMSKIRDYDKLRSQLEYMLFRGETIEYLPDNKEQEQLMMYGFIINDHNTVAIANRIFKMRLTKYFIGESRFSQEMRREALKDKPEFIKDGKLDVPLIMKRFIASQKIIRDIFDEEAEKKFIEEEGREKFLTYLSPIINGVGTFSIEEQTPDSKRMDVVVHYNGRRYIIEMKIWHGERYNEKGEEQISEYLNRFDLTVGYMLSFSFNKNKEPGVKEVKIGNKLLYEGIV